MSAGPAPATPASSARAAGLHYVSDRIPGIRRIKALAIPPAWRDVWICPLADGHIQATGRDARGRKQYRYHARWRQVRDETKYDRMIAFAKALPLIRARVARDLALRGLPRRKLLAAVVRLLETTLIRVGNEEYARHNESFGLTTMRDRHVSVTGARLKFRFRGKTGRQHEIGLTDRRLAAIVKRSRDLPGYELFQYLDEHGGHSSIEAADVNAYLRKIGGSEFTAKDFRTWAGTVLAARALQEIAAANSKTQAKRNVVQAVEAVAGRLGNTKAVCRKCYIHPAVIDAYLDGSLVRTLGARIKAEQRRRRLPAEEPMVLALLRRRLARERRGGRENGPRPLAGRSSEEIVETGCEPSVSAPVLEGLPLTPLILRLS